MSNRRRVQGRVGRRIHDTCIRSRQTAAMQCTAARLAHILVAKHEIFCSFFLVLPYQDGLCFSPRNLAKVPVLCCVFVFCVCVQQSDDVINMEHASAHFFWGGVNSTAPRRYWRVAATRRAGGEMPQDRVKWVTHIIYYMYSWSMCVRCYVPRFCKHVLRDFLLCIPRTLRTQNHIERGSEESRVREGGDGWRRAH